MNRRNLRACRFQISVVDHHVVGHCGLFFEWELGCDPSLGCIHESIECDDGSTTSIRDRTAMVELSLDEVVTCVFTNERRAIPPPRRGVASPCSETEKHTMDLLSDHGVHPSHNRRVNRATDSTHSRA